MENGRGETASDHFEWRSDVVILSPTDCINGRTQVMGTSGGLGFLYLGRLVVNLGQTRLEMPDCGHVDPGRSGEWRINPAFGLLWMPDVV